MAPDRSLMGELHERFLAELNGGRKSRASGSTWRDQGDGRGNALTEEFAFAWDGKSTRGKGIDVTRAMIAKIREQAAGERPMIGLRFYGTDDLKQVDEDWIAIPAADWAELLAAARLAGQAQDAMRRVAEADELLAAGRKISQSQAEQEGWLPDPGWVREREARWADPPPPPSPPLPLHGNYPSGLPVPPPQMWPCLVVDARHGTTEPDSLGLVSNGYWIAADGRVTDYGVSSVRWDMGLGVMRLYVNDTIVRSGQLYIDGALRMTVGPPSVHVS